MKKEKIFTHHTWTQMTGFCQKIQQDENHPYMNRIQLQPMQVQKIF